MSKGLCGFGLRSLATAAFRMKGVVNPQAIPTSKKPTTQRQMGGSGVDWTSIAFNAEEREL